MCSKQYNMNVNNILKPQIKKQILIFGFDISKVASNIKCISEYKLAQ